MQRKLDSQSIFKPKALQIRKKNESVKQLISSSIMYEAKELAKKSSKPTLDLIDKQFQGIRDFDYKGLVASYEKFWEAKDNSQEKETILKDLLKSVMKIIAPFGVYIMLLENNNAMVHSAECDTLLPLDEEAFVPIDRLLQYLASIFDDKILAKDLSNFNYMYLYGQLLGLEILVNSSLTDSTIKLKPQIESYYEIKVLDYILGLTKTIKESIGSQNEEDFNLEVDSPRSLSL